MKVIPLQVKPNRAGVADATTLVVGLFNLDKGLLTGHGFSQLGIQLIGVLAFAAFSAFSSWIVWAIDTTARIRFRLNSHQPPAPGRLHLWR